MIDFYNGQITDILPDNMRNDPIVIAISYSISKMIKKAVNYADKAGIYASVDILDEKALDLLAVELRTQYYGDWLNLEEKREIIKKTLLWYCKAGTVSVVTELTNLVWKSDCAEVQEWFEYESGPYLFRIVLGTDMNIEEELIDAFLNALWKVKNTRSHLESITFKRRLEQNLYTGAALHSLGNIVITDVWKDKYEMRSSLYNGTGVSCIKRIQIKEG